jgi:hypothetical protein
MVVDYVTRKPGQSNLTILRALPALGEPDRIHADRLRRLLTRLGKIKIFECSRAVDRPMTWRATHQIVEDIVQIISKIEPCSTSTLLAVIHATDEDNPIDSDELERVVSEMEKMGYVWKNKDSSNNIGWCLG